MNFWMIIFLKMWKNTVNLLNKAYKFERKIANSSYMIVFGIGFGICYGEKSFKDYYILLDKIECYEKNVLPVNEKIEEYNRKESYNLSDYLENFLLKTTSSLYGTITNKEDYEKSKKQSEKMYYLSPNVSENSNLLASAMVNAIFFRFLTFIPTISLSYYVIDRFVIGKNKPNERKK